MENILATRYSCKEITSLFEQKNRYLLEREFWISVLKLQIQEGLNVPLDAVQSYEKVKNQINLQSIEEREFILKHDVKARIEEFNELAGHEFIHIGLTSRDLTDNIELFQIKTAFLHIHAKSLMVLKILGEKIDQYKTIEFVARTHNVPAQLSNLGKRFSVVAEELIIAIAKLEYEISNLAFRGLKGAIGTSSDLTSFFTAEQIQQIEIQLAQKYGFEKSLTSVGQVYPRSFDFGFVSTLVQLTSSIENFALNFRLMAGYGFVSEAFSKSQVGSSAMPHKKNARTAERISGLCVVLKGLCNMTMSITGNQWNEGDVSCSVVRRVVIPDSFFAVDGILNSAFSLLGGMVVGEDLLRAEVDAELPNLVSSSLMMESVKNGVGRELAHLKIKEIVLKFGGNLENFKREILKAVELKISQEVLNKVLISKGSNLAIAIQQCESIKQTIKNLTINVDSELNFGQIR